MTNCNYSIDNGYPNIITLRNNDADIEINTYPPSGYPPLTTMTFLYEFFNGTEALPVPSTDAITGTLNIKYQYGVGGRETTKVVDLSTDNKTVILDAGNIAFLSVTNLTGCNFIRVTLQTYANTVSNPTTGGGSGGDSTPFKTAISITAEAQNNNYTPSSSTTHNILAIDYNNLYLRNTITLQTASYNGVVEISNISNSNRAISTKIIFPDASSKIVSLNKNSTIVYNVINDVYTSYNVVTRVVQSMAIDNVPLLATTPIAGLARTLNMVYELSNQTNTAENGTYECTNATTGQLAVIELASNRPQLARLNVIDGEVATRGGIFEWWVEDDAFTTVWKRLDNTIGITTQYKTLAIATLVYGVPQELVVAWDAPFSTATQAILSSCTNDQNITINIVEKQGTLTNAGATFIISSNNNSMDITGISIKFVGLGN